MSKKYVCVFCQVLREMWVSRGSVGLQEQMDNLGLLEDRARKVTLNLSQEVASCAWLSCQHRGGILYCIWIGIEVFNETTVNWI